MISTRRQRLSLKAAWFPSPARGRRCRRRSVRRGLQARSAVHDLAIERVLDARADLDHKWSCPLLSETTTPVRVLRLPLASAISLCLLTYVLAAHFELADDGLDAGDVLFALLERRGVLTLTGRKLEAQVEKLALFVLKSVSSSARVFWLSAFICSIGLHCSSPPNVGRLGRRPRPVPFLMNLDLMGSLCAARRRASRASSSVTPTDLEQHAAGLAPRPPSIRARPYRNPCGSRPAWR